MNPLTLFLLALLLALSLLLVCAVKFGKVKQLLLSMFSLLFCLLVLEVCFRMLDLRGFYEDRTRDVDHVLVPRSELPKGVSILFKPNSSFDFNYDSNPRGYFNEKNGITYQVNNLGFRDHDYSVNKEPGLTRIMILGDSFAFGEGVRKEHMFTHLIEEELKAQGYHVELLNFSVGGWGTRDQISYLEQFGVDFQPDIILVAYVLNDATYAGELDVWNAFRQQYENSSLRFSYLLSYAYAKLGQRFFLSNYAKNLTKRSSREKGNWEASFADLDRGKEIAESIGATYRVGIIPFMYDFSGDCPFIPIHKMIESHCQASGIPVLDLFPAFQGQEYSQLWAHPSDPHPNETGHEIIANELIPFLKQDL